MSRAVPARPRILTAIAVTACAPAILLGTSVPAHAAGQEASYIVVLEADASVRAQARETAADGVDVGQVLGNVDALVVTATAAEVRDLRNDPDVAFVVPNRTYTVDGTQASPPSWGLDRVDQAALPLNASYSYAGDGAGVNAYIVDTGVRPTHVDFTGRVRSGFSTINDGRGSSDCHGHGTHVAGTVAGAAYGVAKAATIVPVRAMGCGGSGSGSDILAAINWIISDHQAGAPAVANLSLGVGAADAAIDAAINSLVADGVVVVAAAGNSSVDACTSSPGRTPAAITVAATEPTDAQASYSNRGSCVDLYAPGSSITSADYLSDTGSSVKSGTSMAAPHVAGAAALILGAHAAYTPAQVTSQLLSETVPNKVTGASAGTPNKLLQITTNAGTGGGGGGGGTATTPPTTTLPGSVGSLAVTPGVNSAVLTWVKATYPAAYPTRSVKLEIFKAGVLVKTVTLGATSATYTATLLTAGSVYTFKLTPANVNGAGPSRITDPTTILSPSAPAAPATLTAVAAATAPGVVLKWTAGSNGGATVTGSVVTAYRNGVAESAVTLKTAALTYTYTTLTGGAAYTFGVRSVNVAGPGAEKVTAPFTALVPSAPGAASGVTAVVGAVAPAVTLTWTPGSTGNVPVTSQKVFVYTQAGSLVKTLTATALAKTLAVTGLVGNATYVFTVQAVNARGTAPVASSSPLFVPLPAKPGPVTSLNLSYPQPGLLSATWGLGSTGFVPVSGQTVYVYKNGVLVKAINVSKTTTSISITGLTYGSSYQVGVLTSNTLGKAAEVRSNSIVAS